MSSHYDVVTRWVQRMDGGSLGKPLKGSRIFCEGDTIFSYGRHFPMAHALRGADGRVALFLLNGDRYSVSTTRHQSDLRSAVARSHVPNVIVPFEAISAAGIDVQTVKLVEGLPERHEVKPHVAYERPEGSVWRTDPRMEYVQKSDADLQAYADKVNADRMKSWNDQCGYALREELGESTRTFWTQWAEERSAAEYPWEFTVAEIPEYQRREWTQTGTVRRLFLSGRSSIQIDVDEEDGRPVYRWETRRHWLGEALLQGTVRVPRRLRCRRCLQGKVASCVGCHRAGAADVGRGLLFHVDGCSKRYDYDTSDLRCDHCSGGWLWKNFDRTSYFLSGFDRNESRPSYFFCELPKSAHPTTVEEAYDALKPDAVKMAEQMSRRVERQGDIFAIQTSLTKRDLTKQGARYEKRGSLLGTNHVGSEVAYLPDGTTLVRGSLVHAPDFRTPDHARVRLGDGWSVVVKNTVPVTK